MLGLRTRCTVGELDFAAFQAWLDTLPVEPVFVPHHLSHAASSFWGSGLASATCLVYDGGMANEHWFGGVYVSERNFFPQFAISGASYLDMYPEYTLKPEERKAFLADRVGAVAGRKLADKFGWKVGDQIPLRGTIYSGTWTFNLRGIYDGKEAATAERQMFFHWDYLNEIVKKRYPRRADQTGVFIVELKAAAVDVVAEVALSRGVVEIDGTLRGTPASPCSEPPSPPPAPAFPPRVFAHPASRQDGHPLEKCCRRGKYWDRGSHPHRRGGAAPSSQQDPSRDSTRW